MLLIRGNSGSVIATPNSSSESSSIRLRVRTFDPHSRHVDASRVSCSGRQRFTAPQILQVNSINCLLSPEPARARRSYRALRIFGVLPAFTIVSVSRSTALSIGRTSAMAIGVRPC